MDTLRSRDQAVGYTIQALCRKIFCVHSVDGEEKWPLWLYIVVHFWDFIFIFRNPLCCQLLDAELHAVTTSWRDGTNSYQLVNSLYLIQWLHNMWEISCTRPSQLVEEDPSYRPVWSRLANNFTILQLTDIQNISPIFQQDVRPADLVIYRRGKYKRPNVPGCCLLYTSDAADE